MIGYWPHSFFASLCSSRSINTQIKNLANSQPSWPHTWSITHTYCKKKKQSSSLLLRWLPTVLTVSTPEEGWRTKNELFVSTLSLSSWHSQWRLATHLGFHFRSYEYIAACCHGNKQSQICIAIFHLFASFSRVSLGKISWNLAVLWKRFRIYFNLKKNEKFT